MTLTVPWLGLLIALALLAPLRSTAGQEGELSFASELEALRVKYSLPALGAASMHGHDLLELAVTGFRKAGDPQEAARDDRWHLGSCTKSMTATLAAILVERGMISWDTKVGEVFPEMWAMMDDDWREVTLEQLLTHRGGAPHHAPDDLWLRAYQQRGTPREQRLKFVGGLLTREPEVKPGTKFIYSNQSYAIAGAMLEQRTNRAWEELMEAEIFRPLHMRTAGYGAPGNAEQVDQPWGHLGTANRPEPVPPGPQADNPVAIAPAGAVHCSLVDWVRYAAWHASGGKTQPGILSEAAFQKLHTRVPGENYSLGWVVEKRGWAGGEALMHSGSNTMWYAVMWIAPELDLAFVAVTNTGADQGDEACDAVISLLVHRLQKAR